MTSRGRTMVREEGDGMAGATVVEPVRRRAAPRPAGPRRIRVTLARLDPWTALKVSFLFGLAGLVVLLVAVSLLYGLVDAMGVLASLRKFIGDVDTTGGGLVWLGFGRIFFVTLIIGAVNVVLFSALATMGAFIYNVSSEVVGGIEMTLVDRG